MSPVLFNRLYLTKVLVLISILASLPANTVSAETKSAKITPTKKWHEADFVDAHCRGEVEFVLADRTRVDCLTYTQTTS